MCKQIQTLAGREGKSKVGGAAGWDWKERGIDGIDRGVIRLSEESVAPGLFCPTVGWSLLSLSSGLSD